MLDIRGIIYAFLANELSGDLEIIKITDNIDFYPKIISSIKYQTRGFKINLYPIYTITFYVILDDNILLTLSLIKSERKQLSPFPYWCFTNLEEKIINFVPILKESLEIELSESPKIKEGELQSQFDSIGKKK